MSRTEAPLPFLGRVTKALCACAMQRENPTTHSLAHLYARQGPSMGIVRVAMTTLNPILPMYHQRILKAQGGHMGTHAFPNNLYN